nr:replication protein A 70 kDa DNA-binding subunit B [Tanacetum cinerariifolium]
MRLSLLSNTEVDSCTDFNGSVQGFVWRPFKSITDLEKEEDGQFDVVGQVISCEDLDNYDKNGKAGKKPVTLIDDELFANQPYVQSENTATKISTASKNSTKDNFVNKHPIRNIAELLDVEQDETGTMSLSLFNNEVLESQTDKNTTPNEKQKTNKRPVEGEPRSESSTGKKKAVEIKVEKDA